VWPDAGRYVRAVLATTSLDIVFVMVLWLTALTALAVCGPRPRLRRTVVALFLGTAALSALYAVANVIMFGIFGGFLTYHLLTAVGDLRMVRSSVALHLTPAVAAGLVLLPATYLAVLLVPHRLRTVSRFPSARMMAVSACLLAAWAGAGQHAYEREWTTRQDRPATWATSHRPPVMWSRARSIEGRLTPPPTCSPAAVPDVRRARRT
jgi:hypothetical protein